MRKKDIIDLITAHYEGDNRLFFQKTIDILKEFKADGDDALIAHMDFVLKSNVKIAQKREEPKFESEISLEDAEGLGWFVPQESKDVA